MDSKGYEILSLLQEASFLLEAHANSSCPNWEEGVGDCHKDGCEPCRVQRCIDRLDMEIESIYLKI